MSLYWQLSLPRPIIYMVFDYAILISALGHVVNMDNNIKEANQNK